MLHPCISADSLLKLRRKVVPRHLRSETGIELEERLIQTLGARGGDSDGEAREEDEASDAGCNGGDDVDDGDDDDDGDEDVDGAEGSAEEHAEGDDTKPMTLWSHVDGGILSEEAGDEENDEKDDLSRDEDHAAKEDGDLTRPLSHARGRTFSAHPRA